MNIDVVFKLAGSYETLAVANILDIPVMAPATAGVGVLRDTPPDVGSDRWPGNIIIGWRGNLVAWWRSCPDAEAQAFEVGTNGAVTHGVSHAKDAIDPWLKKNKAKIMAEAKQHAGAVGAKLAAHVKAALEEHERAGEEATDLKLEKETALDQDSYDAKAAEELGRMVLSWSGIEPGDACGVREFLKAVEHSSIPEAAGEVGFSITSEPVGKRKR